MRLELEILDGPNKGKRLMLRNGLILGRAHDRAQSNAPGRVSKDEIVGSHSDFFFDDPEMSKNHAVITIDQKNNWNIECLAPNKMRLGFVEVPRAALILGLVFHLGQSSFKVVERVSAASGPWRESLKKWLENNPAQQTSTEICFFARPIRLSFIQGPQYEEVYTISYGPRQLGYNSLDLDLKDSATPPRVVKFFQTDTQPYIENLCGNAATINGAAFERHIICSGDVLRVASNAIELSFLS